MWEGVGDRTELQHIDPHSFGHNRVSFPFFWAAQAGAWGLSLSGCWFSLPHLISNSCDAQLSIGGLRAPSAGCWFPLLQLVSNWLNFLCTELYNSSRPPSCGRHNFAPIQLVHGQGYNSDIPRPDTPVIYTGAFPILSARPGHIYIVLCIPIS